MQEAEYLVVTWRLSCHHDLARPRVADGEDSLQIWRVAANTLNKQSRTAERGGTPAWGLGEGLQLILKYICYEMLHRAGLDWTGLI
jgi:hypothetical protein